MVFVIIVTKFAADGHNVQETYSMFSMCAVLGGIHIFEIIMYKT